jgi:hypothetical protein
MGLCSMRDLEVWVYDLLVSCTPALIGSHKLGSCDFKSLTFRATTKETTHFITLIYMKLIFLLYVS